MTTNATSASILRKGFGLAAELGVRRVMIQAGAAPPSEIDAPRERAEIIWLAYEDGNYAAREFSGDLVVRIPRSPLTRVSQIKLGLFFALAEGHVASADNVVCLSGIHGADFLDTIVVMNTSRELPWFPELGIDAGPTRVPLQILLRAVQIAVRFAAEGREGKPIGALFVIGDPAELAPHTRQLMLNPLEGHPEAVRGISRPDFSETLREIAGLDGAVALDRSGYAVSAGPISSRGLVRSIGPAYPPVSGRDTTRQPRSLLPSPVPPW